MTSRLRSSSESNWVAPSIEDLNVYSTREVTVYSRRFFFFGSWEGFARTGWIIMAGDDFDDEWMDTVSIENLQLVLQQLKTIGRPATSDANN